MIEHTLDEQRSVLHVRPSGPLREEDFEILARKVDPFIKRSGGLRGLLIETADFPGWTDTAAALRHIRFVRNHHREIDKVAIVTDSPIGEVADHLVDHFVAAEIRQFPYGERDAAMKWLNQS
ncbi:SpoIIAA-like [Desulfonatronum thiosulfatophilum]|uniref:SpoIIAA-like n=1 Tax=Desulfonatronum thiosulfatophilum TaxID=617002 RepID=A0A1G6B6Q6_9BACT|nr:STAS/SEC14 domain-containing protein [Desulfonatronum thiosulfatophilum]SDB16281.1 SpoIIAA-like [Desulfonatronum thiosulfatophilum]